MSSTGLGGGGIAVIQLRSSFLVPNSIFDGEGWFSWVVSVGGIFETNVSPLVVHSRSFFRLWMRIEVFSAVKCCPVQGEGLFWASRLCVVVVQGDAGEGVGGVGGAAVLHCTVVLCGVVGWKWGISYLDFISISDPVSCHSC